MKKTLMAALIAAGGILAASSAHAATVDVSVGGMNWKVSTIDGVFGDLLSTLDDQAWWGDGTLAGDFAEAVGFSLGGNVYSPTLVGPAFAYTNGSTTVFDACALFSGATTASCGATNKFSAVNSNPIVYTFAIAEKISAVPLPAGLPLLAAGIGFLGLMGRRKRAVKSAF